MAISWLSEVQSDTAEKDLQRTLKKVLSCKHEKKTEVEKIHSTKGHSLFSDKGLQR